MAVFLSSMPKIQRSNKAAKSKCSSVRLPQLASVSRRHLTTSRYVRSTKSSRALIKEKPKINHHMDEHVLEVRRILLL